MKNKMSMMIFGFCFGIAFSVVVGALLIKYNVLDYKLGKEEVINKCVTVVPNEDKEDEYTYEDVLKEKMKDRVDRVIFEQDDKIINLTDKGNIIINNEVVLSSVVEAYTAKSGMSDTCMGNEYLLFIMEDGTLSSLSLDAFVCMIGEDNIVIDNNIADLKEVIDIEGKVIREATEYEPAEYAVAVKTFDGEEKDITSYLKR